MTTENISNQLDKPKLLTNARVRKHVIQNADPHLIKAICDIVYNVLEGRINISEKDRKRLSKYKTHLRHICKPSSIRHKKKYLQQKGGFIQFLIPAVIEGLSSLISAFTK